MVTGASQGIGRAIALALADAGADVLLHTGRRRQQLQVVAREVQQRGCRAEIFVGDLSEPAGAAGLVEAAWQRVTGVQIWVNNAGADVLTGAAANWSFEEKLNQLWKVDVQATIQLSRLVGRRMCESAAPVDDLVILNLGWDQAETGMAGDSGEMFSAIKGAVMAFSKSLAKSLAPRVRVNCLAPGWIQTKWGAGASEYWQRRAQDESLMGRWGTPADVAAAARFLVSPAASFITGQILAVNGGFRGSAE